MARLLGITENALKHRMRRGGGGLDYRLFGNKYLFKRPGANIVNGPPLATPKTTHEKTLEDYDRKVQKRLFPKRYDRGATHEEHGGNQVEKASTRNQFSNTTMK